MPSARKKSPHILKKIAAFIGNVLFACLLLIMLFIIFSLVQSRVLNTTPSIAGYRMYIVIGGSMSPTFEAGSLAFVKPVPPEEIAAGDIITFHSENNPNNITTHRVREVLDEKGEISFITRGDANDVDDTPVPVGNVIGRVDFTIPYAGYLMNFSRSKQGMLALVIIPGILIIIYEIRNLFRYAAELEKEQKAAVQAASEGRQQ
jgi:signal peptidase